MSPYRRQVVGPVLPRLYPQGWLIHKSCSVDFCLLSAEYYILQHSFIFNKTIQFKKKTCSLIPVKAYPWVETQKDFGWQMSHIIYIHLFISEYYFIFHKCKGCSVFILVLMLTVLPVYVILTPTYVFLFLFWFKKHLNMNRCSSQFNNARMLTTFGTEGN